MRKSQLLLEKFNGEFTMDDLEVMEHIRRHVTWAIGFLRQDLAATSASLPG